jgi:hypothetical protein
VVWLTIARRRSLTSLIGDKFLRWKLDESFIALYYYVIMRASYSPTQPSSIVRTTNKVRESVFVYVTTPVLLLSQQTRNHI